MEISEKLRKLANEINDKITNVIAIDKENLVLDILNCKIKTITEIEKQIFEKYYLKILESGRYPVIKKNGEIILSSKNPEMAAKRIKELPDFIKNVFKEVK